MLQGWRGTNRAGVGGAAAGALKDRRFLGIRRNAFIEGPYSQRFRRLALLFLLNFDSRRQIGPASLLIGHP